MQMYGRADREGLVLSLYKVLVSASYDASKKRKKERKKGRRKRWRRKRNMFPPHVTITIFEITNNSLYTSLLLFALAYFFDALIKINNDHISLSRFSRPLVRT